MYKIAAVAITSLLLVGCEGTGGQDWADNNGCEKYFSETPRDLAACKEYVKAKEQKTEYASGSLAVTQAAEGTKVSETQGIKNNEESESSSLTE